MKIIFLLCACVTRQADTVNKSENLTTQILFEVNCDFTQNK